MIGGVIIGITHHPKEANSVFHVNTADCPHFPKHPRGECPNPHTCCVYTDGLKEDGTQADLKIGDSFWWQSGSCYWTPQANRTKPNGRDGIDYDIRLKKIGYSH